jgi:hypothetical protein
VLNAPKVSLEVEKIKNLLVVSLFDIDTEEKISDGDNDKITVLDTLIEID